MKLLGAVLLAAGLLSTAAQGEQPPWPDEPSRTCFFQMLSSVDSEFCRGDLEIIYPELGDVGCTYIPKCHQYRQRISREWGSPRVRYPRAEKSKKYVLVLVDPDAPSRANPRNRFWRHWLGPDIPGSRHPPPPHGVLGVPAARRFPEHRGWDADSRRGKNFRNQPSSSLNPVLAPALPEIAQQPPRLVVQAGFSWGNSHPPGKDHIFFSSFCEIA
ncbi:PREDICTED: phosphatidylethanolamine-binding protein 4 [Pygoscelis adeliae]|uniref:phosphatidylethanolamine-binding protein 4 n=1 Tax=Pygoscelis adeliae TaxID=9238 RepID=UPI0004F4E452|nr:PREDICTED: phosphatidylethanolamine-binding protein 4 [Pygoscelis adeliae]